MPPEYLLRADHEPIDKRFGIFGTPVSYYGVFETQGRGALHMHLLIWGSVSADVLKTAANDPILAEAVSKVWDSQISASIPLDTQLSGYKRRIHKEAAPRYQMEDEPKNVLEDIDIFHDYVNQIAETYQTHCIHTKTCQKTNNGKYQCRLCMPRRTTEFSKTTPVQLSLVNGNISWSLQIDEEPPSEYLENNPFPKRDDRMIVWELPRPALNIENHLELPKNMAPPSNGNITEFSPALTFAVKANTCTSPIGDSDQAKSTVFYCIKYVTKDALIPVNSASLLVDAIEHCFEYESVAKDTGTPLRSAKHIIARTVNNITQFGEYSQTLCASVLLGYHSTIKSHQTKPIFASQQHSAFKSIVSSNDNLSQSEIQMFNEDNHALSDNASETHSNVIELNSSPSDDAIFLQNSEYQNAAVDDSLLPVDFNLNEEQLANNEQVLSYIRPVNNKLVPYSSDYIFRGPKLECLDAYTYFACVIRVPKSKKAETRSNSQGRKPNAVFEFDEKHPLHNTHVQRLVAKTSVPIIYSFPNFPGTNNNPKQLRTWQKKVDLWSEYVAALFIPYDYSSSNLSYDYKSICQWIEELKSGDKVQQIKYEIIKDLAQNMTVNRKDLLVYQKFRGISAYRWSAKETLNDDLYYKETESTADALQKHFDTLKQLQHLNDGKFNPSSIQKYAAKSVEMLQTLYANDSLPTHHGHFEQSEIIRSVSLQELDELDNILKEESLTTLLETVHLAQSTSTNPAGNLPLKDQAFELNEKQKYCYNILKDILESSTSNTPKQTLLLIHGGPGTGKSVLVNYTLEKFGNAAIQCLAPTGIAASLLLNGKTAHSFLDIPSILEKFKPLEGIRLAKLKEKLLNILVIFIDEFSMINCILLYLFHLRLQQAKDSNLPFGGVSIILLGDALQLPPVAGHSLTSTIINSIETENLKVQQGAQLFKQFKKIDLEVQMRASSDPVHTAVINDTRSGNYTAMELLQKGSYQFICKDDFLSDPSFQDAKIIVYTNEEKMAINTFRLEHMAKRNRMPIICWKKQPTGKFATKIPESLLESIYTNYGLATGMFLKGAPISITTNLSVNLSLANGTSALMHSLCLNPESEAEDRKLIEFAKPGERVYINEPLAVNVLISHIKMEQWPKKTKTVDGKTIECLSGSIETNEIILPLKINANVSTPIKLPLNKNSLSFRDFPLELAYAITFHKVQGQTLDRAIVDLNNRPSAICNPCFSCFYVGISRVKKGSHIKLFPFTANGTRERLETLKKDTDYNIWNSRYKRLGNVYEQQFK